MKSMKTMVARLCLSLGLATYLQASAVATVPPPVTADSGSSMVLSARIGHHPQAPKKSGAAPAISLGDPYFNENAPYSQTYVGSCPIRLYTIFAQGPDRNDPSWPTWASNVVSTIVSSGVPITVSNGYWNNLNYTLSALNVGGGTNMWSFFEAVSCTMTDMFYPGSAVYKEWSDDGVNNSLGKTTYYTNVLAVYSPWNVGVTYGGDFNPASYTYYNSAQAGGLNTDPVNMYVTIGSEVVYYIASSNQIAGYLNSYTNVTLTGEWSLTYGPTNATASAYASLQTVGSPFSPVVSVLTRNNTVTVDVKADRYQTVVLQYQAKVWGDPYGWQDVATLNVGSTNGWFTTSVLGTFNTGFFRWYLEGQISP